MTNASVSLEPLAVQNLLTLAEACAKARDVKLSTISRLAHGDPSTLEKIRQGAASITLRKYDETMAWLKDPENWPPATATPKVWEPWLYAKPGRRPKAG